MFKQIATGILLLSVALSAFSGDSLSAKSSARLSAVLDAQSDELKSRYQWRHPGETLSFFGIEPGMTVVEVLPGRGWYSPILVSYLGSKGTLIGADYPLEIWPNFPFGNEAFIAKRRGWIEEWPLQAQTWAGDDGAVAKAMRIGMIPDALDASADAVLFIRALHNLSRFEEKGGFFSSALTDSLAVLKPGGTLGVVQHMAPDGQPAASTNGSRGYMDKAALIKRIEAMGFEYVGSSDVNHNANDVPSEQDIVWRLPPSLMTSGDDAQMKAKYQAIGESNRMTLMFRKPA